MEWSQSVAVIAFGTIVGHGICTCGAVLGGRYLSTKISVKHSMCLFSFLPSYFLNANVYYSLAPWCRGFHHLCVPLRHRSLLLQR